MVAEFSRTFLREGYDMSEVRAFLADVERTLAGQATDDEHIVTAQKATEIEFSVKFRGFDMEQVDAEIDRLIGVLRGLDRAREWEGEREDDREASADASAAGVGKLAVASAASSASVQPPSVSVQPPSVSVQPPSVSVQPPSVSVQPPSVSVQPPSVAGVPAPDVGVPVPDAQQAGTLAAPVSMPSRESFVVPVHSSDVGASLVPGAFKADRVRDALVDDSPITTVVDQVAAQFGTQEAVDEILRSMTQGKEQ
ncbi:DivIVA domain-containing protein [Actinomyces bouchesdurhonensis]|uniref:DivIVA domain-containing protein n=1 Tax=Actinomyces bouchesdurhonensis TaxID=1852361 RepID=UPI00093A629D|nr:DivIVA domain-containing protein [Actinomyces bouchesdurhonensis]